MNNKILFGIGGILVGVIITLLLSPMLWFGSMMPWRTGLAPGQWPAGMGSIDRHFIEQMIPHHDGAIAMANLAIQKSQRQEIKTLANAIIEAQSKEIKDMRIWYKDWFGKDVSDKAYVMMGGMMSQGGMHMGGQEDIKILEASADFDKAFIEAMIPHHQLAIMMAQMLKSGTNRPEMSSLADDIIQSQLKEIKEMQDWYKNWYK
ncbi:MAG: hypothetical protein G01um101413_463 [Parcubacteria group bacterium Gr01-1014_13]|nr:MAG: hypothetical protein G01um101413_463 [Parcubacteria group bacterium Gr01-1014_13]